MEEPVTTIDPHGVDDDNVTTVVAGAPVVKPQAKEYEVSEDGNIVKVAGKTYITDVALKQEREKSSNYAKTLQQLEPLMPEFEQFLAGKKQGRTATVDRATRGVESDYNDDELAGYAITRGYYDQENKPDLKRAKDDLDLMTAIADRRASRAIQPVTQSTTADRAMRNLSEALQQQFTDGAPVADEQYVKAVFDSVPENLKADPETAKMLMVVAAGIQSLDERKSGKRGRREPLFREGAGGRGDREPSNDGLDALDRAAMRARGKTPEQWSKLSKAIGGPSLGGTILDEV